MNNPRITPKERALIKGAIRRVFSRSEIRRRVLDTAEVSHSDPSRPRVKRWCRCAKCGIIAPRYTCDCDHIRPVVPVDKMLETMSWDEIVNNLWCEEKGMQALCEECHNKKTSEERKARNAFRAKGKNKNAKVSRRKPAA